MSVLMVLLTKITQSLLLVLSILLTSFSVAAEAEGAVKPFQIYQFLNEDANDPSLKAFESMLQKMLKAPFAQCGLDSNVIPMPSNRAERLFKNDQVDLELFRPEFRPARIANTTKIPHPILVVNLRVWAHKDAAIAHMGDLQKLRPVVLTEDGWMNLPKVVEHFQLGWIQELDDNEIEKADSFASALKIINSGRADFIVWGEILASRYIRSYQLSNIRGISELPPLTAFFYSWLADRNREYLSCLTQIYQQHFPLDLLNVQDNQQKS